MHILPSALPPKGEARRYVANDFLNLIALPDGEGEEEEAGSFLNHKENRVKPKISTMVFLGERKSILPGAEAAADKDLLLCTQQMERRAEEAKAEADLEGFPVSLFLIVLAGVKEKTETEKDAAKGMDLRCRIRLHDKP